MEKKTESNPIDYKSMPIVDRFKSSVGLPINRDDELNETGLLIENVRTGLKIQMSSTKESMKSLINLSKEIKKEFF